MTRSDKKNNIFLHVYSSKNDIKNRTESLSAEDWLQRLHAQVVFFALFNPRFFHPLTTVYLVYLPDMRILRVYSEIHFFVGHFGGSGELLKK